MVVYTNKYYNNNIDITYKKLRQLNSFKKLISTDLRSQRMLLDVTSKIRMVPSEKPQANISEEGLQVIATGQLSAELKS